MKKKVLVKINDTINNEQYSIVVNCRDLTHGIERALSLMPAYITYKEFYLEAIAASYVSTEIDTTKTN